MNNRLPVAAPLHHLWSHFLDEHKVAHRDFVIAFSMLGAISELDALCARSSWMSKWAKGDIENMRAHLHEQTACHGLPSNPEPDQRRDILSSLLPLCDDSALALAASVLCSFKPDIRLFSEENEFGNWFKTKLEELARLVDLGEIAKSQFFESMEKSPFGLTGSWQQIDRWTKIDKHHPAIVDMLSDLTEVGSEQSILLALGSCPAVTVDIITKFQNKWNRADRRRPKSRTSREKNCRRLTVVCQDAMIQALAWGLLVAGRMSRSDVRELPLSGPSDTAHYDWVIAIPSFDDRNVRKNSGLPIPTRRIESAMLQQALGCLKPEGRAFAWMPGSFAKLSSSSGAHLRQWLFERWRVDAVLELPITAFIESKEESGLMLCMSNAKPRIGYLHMGVEWVSGRLEWYRDSSGMSQDVFVAVLRWIMGIGPKPDIEKRATSNPEAHSFSWVAALIGQAAENSGDENSAQFADWLNVQGVTKQNHEAAALVRFGSTIISESHPSGLTSEDVSTQTTTRLAKLHCGVLNVDALAKRQFEITYPVQEDGLHLKLQELADRVENLRVTTLDEIAEIFPGVRSNKLHCIPATEVPQEQKAGYWGYFKLVDFQSYSDGAPETRDQWEPGQLVAPSSPGMVRKKFHLKTGDVLVARLSKNDKRWFHEDEDTDCLGRTCVFQRVARACVPSNEMFVIRPRSSAHAEVVGHLLVGIMSSKEGRDWLKSRAPGSVIQRLQIDAMRAMPVLDGDTVSIEAVGQHLMSGGSFDSAWDAFEEHRRPDPTVEFFYSVATSTPQCIVDSLEKWKREHSGIPDGSFAAWWKNVLEMSKRLVTACKLPDQEFRMRWLERWQREFTEQRIGLREILDMWQPLVTVAIDPGKAAQRKETAQERGNHILDCLQSHAQACEETVMSNVFEQANQKSVSRNRGDAVQELFGNDAAYFESMKHVLDLRLGPEQGDESEMIGSVRGAIESMHRLDIAAGAFREIFLKALELIWEVEIPNRKVPYFTRGGPPRLCQKKDCNRMQYEDKEWPTTNAVFINLLDLMTDDRKWASPPKKVNRKIFAMLAFLLHAGDFREHKNGQKMTAPFVVSGATVATELVIEMKLAGLLPS